MKEGMRLAREAGSAPTRQLSDLTGPFYTLVLENRYDSLVAWECSMGTGMATDEMAAWYERFKPPVESGYREIFTVIEGA
jgi:hypothetical protein